MYEAFFGLRVKPFNLTPNPHFLYLSKTHREVYAHLLYGIQNRVGFIEVTGEVGTGKTTILRSFLYDLDPAIYQVSLIFNPKLTAIELLRTINREFGVPDEGATPSRLVDALNRFLLDKNFEGRVPVLIIDEAQNLSADVLEQIRLISNLETETEKLIQIVLAGQPELGAVLGRPELRQLDQRIAVRQQLSALDLTETCDYIRHRLKVAGRPDGELFAPQAMKLIHRLSGGIPRLVNLLADRTLLVGYSEGVGRMSRREVKQAWQELRRQGQGEARRQRKWFSVMAVFGFLLVLGLLLSSHLRHADPGGAEREKGQTAMLTETDAALHRADAEQPGPSLRADQK